MFFLCCSRLVAQEGIIDTLLDRYSNKAQLMGIQCRPSKSYSTKAHFQNRAHTFQFHCSMLGLKLDIFDMLSLFHSRREVKLDKACMS